MSRSDIPNVEDRTPFYLYVDEFQNFATDSFATILSEARKYGLTLTVANQYTAQMQDTVRDAVFGNVGTTISFRVSADDAPILAKPFAPQFEPEDLLQMNNRHFIISMVIKGEKLPAFSATTLALPPRQTDFSPDIIANTRALYGRPRAEVEAEIQALMASSIPPQPQPQSQAQAKKWPIDRNNTPVNKPTVIRSEGQVATSAVVQPPVQVTSQTTQVAPRPPEYDADGKLIERPKRKRTRSRRKKTNPDGSPQTSPAGQGSGAPQQTIQTPRDNNRTE